MDNPQMDPREDLEGWKDAHTALALLQPYVEYGVRRARTTGRLTFELRIPASQVFGLYRVLCRWLSVSTDPSPYMATFRETAGQVEMLVTRSLSRGEKAPTRGRRRR